MSRCECGHAVLLFILVILKHSDTNMLLHVEWSKNNFNLPFQRQLPETLTVLHLPPYVQTKQVKSSQSSAGIFM